ncbi:hypothetical protein ACFLXY_08010 [Chloroflexota bacterium]
MAINFGDRILYEDRNGECIKGTIVDIWRFARNEITDYLVELDSGRYVNVKPHFPNWFKLDDRILWFENNRLEFNFLSPRSALLVNV